MKVAHIIVRFAPGMPGWGGAAKAATDWAKVLARKGVDISVFTVGDGSEEQYVVKGHRLTVNFSPEAKGRIMKWWPFYTPALGKTLSTEAFEHDIEHIHEIWHYPCYAAYRAAKKAKKPYIVTVHGALEPWCLNYKALKKKIYAALIQRRILNGAAAIHAITQDEVKHIQAFGVHSPIVMIPNGIDPEEFYKLPPREELERRYPELEGKIVVLFLGRIHPVKGLDILARAFGRIARDRGDVRLVIVGPDDDGYQIQVEQMLKTYGVRDKTIFTGLLSGQEKLAALSRSDIFVLPSYSEGFSMAILEALACGVPVLIMRQCHFPEVAEAKAGIVIDPDPDQLAEALTKLLDNPELRKEMGANGRRLVTERFTWDKIVEQMIELYRNVLRNRSQLDLNR